jgi:hypothetical protein
MTKETPLTQAQESEFCLNRLGYYCKVRSVWNQSKKKNDFKFDIVQYENDKEVMIQAGKKIFSCGELEAIKERDKVIEYYLNKLKSEKTI